MTEFVVERTITFQTANRSVREIRFNDKFLLKSVLASFKRDSKTRSLLVFYESKTFRLSISFFDKMLIWGLASSRGGQTPFSHIFLPL